MVDFSKSALAKRSVEKLIATVMMTGRMVRTDITHEEAVSGALTLLRAEVGEVNRRLNDAIKQVAFLERQQEEILAKIEVLDPTLKCLSGVGS